MDCGHVEELLPGYALNALDAAEAAGVEEHLDSCASCTAAYRGEIESVVLLSQAATPAALPDRLKSRLMARIPSPPRREPERAGWFAGRYSFGYVALGAAASVMIVALAAFIGVSIGMSNKIGSLERENGLLTARVDEMGDMDDKLVEMTEEQRSISYAMADPYSKVVPLSAGQESPSAKALLLVSHQDGVGILMAFGMTPLPHGDHYDVWLSSDDSQYMMGALSVDDTGWGVLTIVPEKPMDNFEHILVTHRTSTQTSSSDEAATVLWGALNEG